MKKQELIIAKLAKAAKKTPAKFLLDLIESHKTLRKMAIACQCSQSTIEVSLNRYNVDKPDARSFVYDGIADTMAGHSRRCGVSNFVVSSIKYDYKLTSAEALEVAISRKEKNKSMSREMVAERNATIKLLRDQGLSKKEIAEYVGISLNSAHGILKRIEWNEKRKLKQLGVAA